MSRYLLIDNTGLVISVVKWDGKTGLSLPDTLKLRAIPDNVPAGKGWLFDGKTWIAPVEPETVNPPDDTPDRETAVAELTGLGLSERSARILAGLPPETGLSVSANESKVRTPKGVQPFKGEKP